MSAVGGGHSRTQGLSQDQVVVGTRAGALVHEVELEMPYGWETLVVERLGHAMTYPINQSISKAKSAY
jgi:hypothetical protein